MLALAFAVGLLRSLVLLFPSRSGLLAGLTHLTSCSSVSRAVQDVLDIYGEELGVVPPDVVLALRDAFSGSGVDDFWTIW